MTDSNNAPLLQREPVSASMILAMEHTNTSSSHTIVLVSSRKVYSLETVGSGFDKIFVDSILNSKHCIRFKITVYVHDILLFSE